jgi:hypothetical protein
MLRDDGSQWSARTRDHGFVYPDAHETSIASPAVTPQHTARR